jgi:hypothetical protein
MAWLRPGYGPVSNILYSIGLYRTSHYEDLECLGLYNPVLAQVPLKEIAPVCLLISSFKPVNRYSRNLT